TLSQIDVPQSLPRAGRRRGAAPARCGTGERPGTGIPVHGAGQARVGQLSAVGSRNGLVAVSAAERMAPARPTLRDAYSPAGSARNLEEFDVPLCSRGCGCKKLTRHQARHSRGPDTGFTARWKAERIEKVQVI